MVAIFTGSGTGFERGSGNVLGSSGLLGSAGFGRSGQGIFLNAANGNLLINRQDEFLVGRGPDAGVARTYNSLGNMSDDNGDNWRQSTQRAVRLNGTANSWGSSVTHRMGDGSEVAYYWSGSAYVATGGAGVHDKIINIDGSVLRWTDGDSGIVETYENDGVTEWRRLKTVADTSGNAVTYGYIGDKLTSITTANGETITYSWTGNHITQVNSGDGTLTRYFYDSYDRLSQVDIELTSGGSVYSTSYTYHGSSKLIATISETDGSSVSIAYDNDNRVTSLTQTVSTGVTRTTSLVYGEGYTSVTDPAGQVTTLSYDWNGALVQITAPPAYAGAAQQIVTFGYNEDGDLSSVTDALGQITNYFRDSWGNVVFEIDRLENVTERTFNAAHKLLTETRPGSGTTRYVYDSLDRLVYVITPEGRVTRNWYDAAGQLYFISDFPDYLYDLSGFASDEAPTQVQLNNWCDGLPETASSEIAYMLFDERGNVKQRRQASQNNHYGSPNTAGGYSDEFFTYDSAGRLLTRRIEGQATESFVYDGLGRIKASTDLNGGTTSFVFNDAATQTVVTLANGFVQTSTYNKAGELVGFTESGAHTTVGEATYLYDRNGRVRRVTDASGIKSYYLYDKVGRKIADINEAGWITEYRYDANNRLVATARYSNGSVAPAALFTYLADPNADIELAAYRPVAYSEDIWTWTVYDKEGRVIEAIEGDGSVTTYQYDASGRLIRTTGYFNKLSAGQIAALKATSPTTSVLPGAHANDSVARTFYDKDGNLIGVLNGEGYLSRIVYDGAGRKVQELSWTNPTNAADRANGSLQTLINGVGADARTMRYVYDGQGLLRFQIDSLFHVTEFGYGSGPEAHGPVRQTTVYAASIPALSSYTYAAVKSAVAGFAGHADNRLSFGVYDAAGRLAYSIDAGGGVIGYIYDTMGQPIRKVEYANLRWTGSLPTKAEMDSWVATYPTVNDRVTRYYYNARGELRFTVDAEGYVTRTDYDAEGRKVWQGRWNTALSVSDSSTIDYVKNSTDGWIDYTSESWSYDITGRIAYAWDGEGGFTHYLYQYNGNLAWEIRQEGQPDESKTFYAHDAAGKLVARYDAVGTPQQAGTAYSYDGLGNLVSTTDANGHVTSWTYDKLGRKLTETNAASGVTSFEYNAFGDLVRTIDARLNSTWSYYDKLGRVVTTRDAENYVTETSYTVFGEVASVTRRYERATNTASVTAPPAVLANAKDATTSFAYDKLGRVKTTTDAEGAIETNWYDAFGGVVQTQNKLGGITVYSRNPRGLVYYEYVYSPVHNEAGTQTAAAYYRNVYLYDARGNLVHQVEAYGLAERRDTYFAYDKAGRLTSKSGTPVSYVDQANHIGLISATPVESYKYDKRGNLVETTDANGARTLFWYDDLDRKVAELGALGTFSTYGYDGVGNLVSSRTYAATIALPVTPGGTPPAAPGGEYRETSYAYDAINRLTSTSVAGVRTGVWNGSSFVLSTAAITTSYVYDAAGNVVSTTDANGVTSYAYYDKLDRKTLAVDVLGYATRWEFDAEGNALTERRYAIQFSGASVAAPPALAESTSDRVTGFVYDKMGRRIAEHRYGVEAYVVNASTGVLSGNGGTASIYYSYNGLGQVTRKTEATGEYSDYEYDLAGRLVREQRATITDYTGTAIRPVVSYYYDGLGNLVRSVQAGGTAADRVTRYVFGAGGRLFSKVDPSGSVTEYYYDTAGNVVRENYARAKSDGSAVYEGILYTRDILGRVTAQTVGAWTGSSWNKGDAQQIQYNAYGEVAQKGVNGGWQEQFAYDGAGRLYRSNTGDGVWRYYVHDANGNQSAIIESEGSSIAGLTLDQVISNATGGFAYGLGQLYVDGLNVTINAYDKRGQATSARLAQRQLSAAGGTTDIVTSRSYNAFGEVSTETDARGYQTIYGYNAMGRTTYALRASVLVTYENGSQAWVNPSSHNYYDIAGRLIGQDDANGNRTTRTLLAGTGYGGGEAQVAWEWHADGGIVKNGYDRFGDLRRVTDEINRTTAMDYDAMGRLIQVARPSGATEYYAYDVLGQRIKHWNSFLKMADGVTPDVETTDYDVQGRVVRTVAFGGDTTTTSYVWEGGAGANGLGAAPGAWTTLTTYANGRQSGDQSDLFGHLIASTDMGGHQSLYVYDTAGRMIQRSGGETINYDYLNTGLVARVTIGIDTSASQGNFTQDRTSYTYDAAGNRLTEEFTRLTGAMVDHGYWEYDYSYGYPDQYWVSDWQYETSLVTISSQSASYDALGRLIYWSAAATGTMPAASTSYAYDANSNIRRSVASFSLLDQNGTAYSAGTQDYWYRYDSMNRVVTAKGIQTGSGIVRGGQGVDLLYDAAGQRTQSLSTATAWGQVYVEVYDPNMYGGWGGYTWQYQDVSYEADNREDYTYWGDGQLKDVRVARSGYSDNGDGTITVTAPAATGTRKANYWYDGQGRLERQIDWGDADPDVYGNGALDSAIYDKRLEYNAKGQVRFEQLFQRQGGIVQVNETTSDYGTGTGYALGALVSSTTNAWRTGVPYSTSTTSNSYVWYDGAALASTTVTGTTSGTTTYNYNGFGQLVGAWISDGRSRSVSFLNDANGMAVRRDEQDYVGQGDPHEIWYRFAGREMGYSGNNGTLETDYLSSVASRPLTPGSGAFRGGASYGQAHADFDQFYNPVTSYEQGGGGGSYTVRGGETLSTIAAQLWGDSNLWYRLAESNGLSAGSALAEGQRLTIPAGVMRSSYSASTFAPYDPAAALGDTSPTTPTPQAPRKSKSNNCGVFGQLLLVVVAVAVTVASQGTLAGVLGSPVLGGAAAGVAGSVVSQTVGLATGIQNKFNFGAVAMAGIAGGIGGGLSSVKGLQSIAGSKFLGDVARGAIGSTLTQGVGVATGLQSKFDFAGVAVAGLGAGVGGAVARGIDGKRLFGMTIGGTSSAGNAFLSGTASGVASAAARSLVTGTDFGDNLLAALPDVIGSTIGRMVAGKIGGSGRGGPINLLDEVKDGSYSPEAVRAAELSDRYGAEFNVDEDGNYYTTASAADLAQSIGKTNPNFTTGTEKITFAGAYQYNQITNDADGRVINYFLDDPMYGGDWESAPKATTFDVLWAGNEDGAVRFISGGSNGRTYLYEGGATRYSDLGLNAVFGAPIAAGSDPNFVAWAQNHDQMVGNIIQARVDKALAQVDFEAGIGLNIMLAPTLVMGGGGAGGYAVREGGYLTTGALARGTVTARVGQFLRPAKGGAGRMFSSGELMGVERASPELLASVSSKRSVVIAKPGSDELKMLDYFGAEASVNTTENGILNGSIVLRENPSKAAVMEEFLHGTQARLGVIDRLGSSGLGSAETHVKDFMIRHQRMIGLSNEDVAILKILRDKGY